MTEHFISMFIDDELDLDEKIEFVETLHSDASYKTEAVTLLRQEKRLRDDPVQLVPPAVLQSVSPRRWTRWLRPLLIGLGSAAAVIVLFWTAMLPNSAMDAVQPSKIHRFIIYRPDISSVQLTGSFTGWQPTAMHRIGDSGYWEVEMALPDGEHRFAYLLEGSQRIADPTIPARERDDFGGENSILRVAS
jgi:hypothetical protein